MPPNIPILSSQPHRLPLRVLNLLPQAHDIGLELLNVVGFALPVVALCLADLFASLVPLFARLVVVVVVVLLW